MGQIAMMRSVFLTTLATAATAGAATVEIAAARFETQTTRASLDPIRAAVRQGQVVRPTSTRSTIPTAAATGGELGFETVVTNTRGPNGTAPAADSNDSDDVGIVARRSNGGGAYSFAFEDTDGLLTTTFDAVALTGFSDVTVSVDYAVQKSGASYNASSVAAVEVLLAGGSTVRLLDLGGSQGINAVADNAFRTVSATLPAGTTAASVRFAVDTFDDGEFVYFDNVVFTGELVAVPEPLAAGSVAALGGLALSRRGPRQPVCQAGDQ